MQILSFLVVVIILILIVFSLLYAVHITAFLFLICIPTPLEIGVAGRSGYLGHVWSERRTEIAVIPRQKMFVWFLLVR